MRYKISAIILGMVLGCAMLAGCGTTDTENVGVSAGAEGAEYTGEITELRSDGFTIVTEDADELDVNVTDDTVFTVAGFGGRGDFSGEGGDFDGEAPEMPEGSDGEVPERPDGDADGDQEMPDMSEEEGGEMPDMQTPPTGDADSDGGTAPERPDGDDAEMPDGDGDFEMPDGDGDFEMPDGGAQGGNAPDGDMGDGAMSLGLSDLSEGDTVTVTLDDDGNALTVAIFISGSFGGDGGSNSQGD